MELEGGKVEDLEERHRGYIGVINSGPEGMKGRLGKYCREVRVKRNGDLVTYREVYEPDGRCAGGGGGTDVEVTNVVADKERQISRCAD